MHSQRQCDGGGTCNISMEENTRKCWLMKAEPDSRVVKGKDVKACPRAPSASTTLSQWDPPHGKAFVIMKRGILGDKILFYHSNCKNPGIAGFAEVSKEAYPDYTAWDSTHPYFDEKSDREHPRWFMVEVKFISRARNFVPLSVLRYIADLPAATLPEALDYVGEDGINEIKAMPLVTRGRLSVQRVSARCWEVIQTMAGQGGWDNISLEKKKVSKTRHPGDGTRAITQRRRTRQLAGHGEDDDTKRDDPKNEHRTNTRSRKKRKVSTTENEALPHRESLRRQM